MSEIDPAEAVAEAVMSGARNRAEWQFRQALRDRLPRFLWPLIPGEGGTVKEELGREVSRRFWSWFTGLLFSIFFFGVIFTVICGLGSFVVASIGWQLYTL